MSNGMLCFILYVTVESWELIFVGELYYTERRWFRPPQAATAPATAARPARGPSTYGSQLGQSCYGSTLANLRKAVNTLEDAARDARRVYGSAHPFAEGCEYHLEKSRAALAAREAPPPGSA